MTAHDIWLRRGSELRPVVLAAALTPFRDDEVEPSSVEENVRAFDALGLDGVLLAGTTGKSFRLRDDERERLVEITREAVADDFFVMVGLPVDPDVAAQSRRLKRFAELGAHGALVPPPWDVDASGRDDAHFAAFLEPLPDAAPLSLFAYHPPSFRAAPLSDAAIDAVAAVPGFAGVKDSLGLRSMAERWQAASSDLHDFDVLLGNARLFHDIGASVSGGILALAGPFAAAYVELARRLGEGQDTTDLIAELEAPLARFETGDPSARLVALAEMYEDEMLFAGDPTARG